MAIWPAECFYLCKINVIHACAFFQHAVCSIIQHFKGGETLPQGMERARSLARSDHYAFIEVYTDKLIAVGVNGQTAIIAN